MIENLNTRSDTSLRPVSSPVFAPDAPIQKSRKIKELSIETLRGLAILLVVAGYIIKDDLSRGADHSIFSSALRFIYYCFTPIRMPLFTVISAYLYASSPATRETLKKLVTGKARRVMIPFAVVSAAQYLIFTLVPVNGPQSLHDIYKVYILPYEQLWFLYSIFWIFAIVGVMDSARLLDTPRKWLACLVISLVLHIALNPTRLFSLNGVNYLFPFFLMGYGIKRYSEVLFTKKMVWGYAAAAFIAYLGYIGLYLEGAAGLVPLSIHKYFGIAVTFSAVPLIFHYRRSVPFLAKIGSYAFGIHLFNKIGLAPIKVLFASLGIRNDIAVFTAYLVGSVAFAIGIQLMLEQYAFTRKYVLGLNDRSAPSPEIIPVRRTVFSTVRLSHVAVCSMAAMLFTVTASFAQVHGGTLMVRSSEFMCQATGMCNAKSVHKCGFKCTHCAGSRHMKDRDDTALKSSFSKRS